MNPQLEQLLPTNTVVGCIGLGIMGAPIARNLGNAGYELRGYARSSQTLTKMGDVITATTSPEDLGRVCDVVVLNVSDTPDVESITLGDKGLIFGMRPGGVVIDMSTIEPSATRRIATKLAERGVAFLDAPVSGGEQGAIAGTLTIMVGGDSVAFERALPLLQTAGKTVTHVGESGAGQVVKECNQIIIGATIEGVAEALLLAKRNGVDGNAARAALLGGFASSKVLEIHGKRMLDGDYAPGFKASLHAKDIGIAIKDGDQNGCPLPVAKLFNERLAKLTRQGGGDLDSAAVYKVIEQDAGPLV